MIRTVIYGCNGKMGQILSNQLLEQDEFQIVAGIDRFPQTAINPFPVFEDPLDYKGEVDTIIDFSNPSNISKLLEFSLRKKASLVIATTGYSEEQLQRIKVVATEIPILHSANMSLGINVLSRVLRQISGILSESFDIEIIEKHHNKKADAPSGTAYLLANRINEALGSNYSFVYGREGAEAKRGTNEIGIHAVRGGTIAGEHSVIFAGLDEVIEFKHTALSKNIFATGAIKAASFLNGKPNGLYSMDDVLESRNVRV